MTRLGYAIVLVIRVVRRLQPVLSESPLAIFLAYTHMMCVFSKSLSSFYSKTYLKSAAQNCLGSHPLIKITSGGAIQLLFPFVFGN